MRGLRGRGYVRVGAQVAFYVWLVRRQRKWEREMVIYRESMERAIRGFVDAVNENLRQSYRVIKKEMMRRA